MTDVDAVSDTAHQLHVVGKTQRQKVGAPIGIRYVPRVLFESEAIRIHRLTRVQLVLISAIYVVVIRPGAKLGTRGPGVSLPVIGTPVDAVVPDITGSEAAFAVIDVETLARYRGHPVAG